jgi:hypothetical protein
VARKTSKILEKSAHRTGNIVLFRKDKNLTANHSPRISGTLLPEGPDIRLVNQPPSFLHTVHRAAL